MKEKWYNKNPILLVILLIIVPPIGLYGVFKRNTKIYKKVLAFFLFIVLCIIYLVVIIASTVSLKKNEKENNKRKEEKANRIVEVIEDLDTTKSFEQEEELKAFQNSWADSVVQEWRGDFIISSQVKFPDTILFELSESATKNFNSNVQHTLPNYQFNYNKRVKEKFRERVGDIYKTRVLFMPNEELKKRSIIQKWERPVFMNRGLVIYSGNEYSKEKIGTLNCIKKEDGEKWYLLLQGDGSYVRIAEYKLRSYYWVSREDPNYNSHTGIGSCKY